jgi:DNA polymerase III subunit beta
VSTQFTTDKEALAAAVSFAAGGIPSNPLIPVRAGLRVVSDGRRATFTGGDAEVTFQASCDVDGTAFDTVVPGRLFMEIVKSIPKGSAHVSLGAGFLGLRSGRSEFSFRTLDGHYPDNPEPAPVCGTVDGEALASAVRKTAPSVSRNDAMPALSAILLEAGDMLDVISTDRYVLAAVACEWLPGNWDIPSALMPAWAAERFCRGISGQVSIGWDERVCTLSRGDFQVTARLIAGEFPAWRRVLPDSIPEIEISSGELAAAVKRAMTLAPEDDSPVELQFVDGEVQVNAAGPNGSTSEIVSTAGPEVNFSALFGKRGLLSGLSVCDDTCRIGFTVPDKPVYIYSGNLRFMILPRRRI